jgi:uncharacterized protein YlzI (FlbEa/FlbD family)
MENNMFIRLKDLNGVEVNVNTAQVLSFVPSSDGGSQVTFVNGTFVVVKESNRMIRHAVSKAAGATASDAEA